MKLSKQSTYSKHKRPTSENVTERSSMSDSDPNASPWWNKKRTIWNYLNNSLTTKCIHVCQKSVSAKPNCRKRINNSPLCMYRHASVNKNWSNQEWMLLWNKWDPELMHMTPKACNLQWSLDHIINHYTW